MNYPDTIDPHIVSTMKIEDGDRIFLISINEKVIPFKYFKARMIENEKFRRAYNRRMVRQLKVFIQVMMCQAEKADERIDNDRGGKNASDKRPNRGG